MEDAVGDVEVGAVDVEGTNIKMEPYTPYQLTIQWHITEQCNQRCTHCYQKDYQFEGLPLEKQIYILEKISEFASLFREKDKRFKAHINFTGGEPFLHNDFIKLLEVTYLQKLFSFGILSNGLLPDDDILQKLKKLKPSFIQISLEGGKTINDKIRGNGSFEIIKKALKTYKRLDIPVMISFTANSLNYKDFPSVVKVSRKYKAIKVWADRYLPAYTSDPLTLSKDQTKEFFQILYAEKNKHRLSSKTVISTNRALQFLICGGKPYQCSAGKNLLTILPNGDLVPCRRLPLVLGNLLTDNLNELYQSNQVLISLRENPANIPDCSKCYYKSSCNGGLKCLSYSTLGDYRKRDPGCWLQIIDT